MATIAAETGEKLMNIAVFGAGSIGCYVGGLLAARGENTVLIGRQPLAEAIAADGLTLTDYRGRKTRLDPGAMRFVTEPAALGEADYILVTVKSDDTGEAARAIAAHGKKGGTVVSLQNGVDNSALLTKALPDFRVLAAMVPFNVIRQGKTHFHRASEGAILIERSDAATLLSERFNQAGLPSAETGNIEAVQWTKLAMNLNNALNVLSGQPLKSQLEDADYRAILAQCVTEALAVMRASGIKPARIGKVRPALIPMVLRLPTPLFRLVAAGMLRIDTEARSSMWEDMRHGRRPEIDHLNGKIVREGERLGVPTPVNALVTEKVKAAFASGRSPGIGGGELRRMLAV